MILITGAAGFIGSNLVAFYNARGRSDLLLCDWLGDDGRWENLAKRDFADLVVPEQLEEFLAREKDRIEVVIHLGAISDTTVRDGNRVLELNYQFTKRLWRWCAAAGRPFVYASSAATYGDGEQGFDDRMDLPALRALRPLNLYGWSKHVFDLYACGQPEVAPPAWYGLKFFNVFGPNEYHKGSMQSLLCKSAPDIQAGRPSRLFRSHHPDFADGGQTRDFVYVDDVCDVVTHLAAGRAPSGLYNVGTGAPRSFLDLIAAGYRAAGREPIIEYVDMPEVLRSRYQYYTCAMMEKLRAAGYNQSFRSLEDAAFDYVDRYLSRTDRFR